MSARAGRPSSRKGKGQKKKGKPSSSTPQLEFSVLINDSGPEDEDDRPMSFKTVDSEDDGDVRKTGDSWGYLVNEKSGQFVPLLCCV